MARPVLPPDVELSLARFRAALAERFGARLAAVLLFGSRARGEARPDSDVDVLVLVEGLTRAERHEVIDVAADLDYEHFVGLAPLVMSTADFERLRAREAGLALDIDREGVSL
ncbi:MAG TPA: nucleotidyltransferase domain-containing protein [Polyangia bacterium]|jgi:predicted nucleotidyltransferase